MAVLRTRSGRLPDRDHRSRLTASSSIDSSLLRGFAGPGVRTVTQARISILSPPFRVGLLRAESEGASPRVVCAAVRGGAELRGREVFE